MPATVQKLHPDLPAPPAKPVGAVIAALDILRCLGGSAEPMRLSDITRALGLNSSTALNILRTLEYERLVVLDRATKRYGLGQGLVELAAPLMGVDPKARRLAEAMAATAHELGATIAIWRRVDDEVELVSVAESPTTMRIAFTVGRRLPMLLGAMGRLIAGRSDLPPEEMRRLFDQVRWSRSPGYEAWLDEVAAARETNWALDSGHVNLGIQGVAVPVETEGPLTRIVSAAMFETPYDDADLQRVVCRLRHIADMV
jgi:DNA-binding IclR family transcriptional regulator